MIIWLIVRFGLAVGNLWENVIKPCPIYNSVFDPIQMFSYEWILFSTTEVVSRGLAPTHTKYCRTPQLQGKIWGMVVAMAENSNSSVSENISSDIIPLFYS